MAFKTRLRDFVERHTKNPSVRAKLNRLFHTTSAIPSITSDNSASSPLLRLPAELRLLIYTATFEHNLLGANNLTLLLTCRQIYHEAQEIGQTNTTFALSASDLDTKLCRLNGISNHGPYQKFKNYIKTKRARYGFEEGIAHIYKPSFCTSFRLDMSHPAHFGDMMTWIFALEIRELILVNISKARFTQERGNPNAENMLGILIFYLLLFKIRSLSTLTLVMDLNNPAEVAMRKRFSDVKTFSCLTDARIRGVKVKAQVPKFGQVIFSANDAEGGRKHTLEVRFLEQTQ
ncbi:hypothetical protein LTS18_005175 [Coniosporium uncinatum]|uniref:Uncharacterized protein n=1 Tax=Coniosporium uncinatum TaxID=93489 RepID=A0ACC3D517_9PEZI|nr:hypothetical protein LTS18_005175 [Coniosporium uncinatum]